LLSSIPSLAHAQEAWLLNGAGSVAAPLNDPYRDAFAAGAIGELGLYRSLIPKLQLGARLSAGGLGQDEEGASRGANNGNFGIGSLGAALRFRPLARWSDPRRGTGLWVEGVAGPGIVENDVRAVLSPGLGYVIDAGSLGIGPMARYIQAIEGDLFDGDDARLATFGIELVFLDNPGKAEVETEEFRPPMPLVPAAGRSEDPDPDRDRIMGDRDLCPNQPETVNGINDHDGCPDSKVAFLRDRLVVDERVFFDYDDATLKPTGKETLDELASLFMRTGYDWAGLRVQGHTDSRGTEPYNEDLSLRRAAAVKSYLASMGVNEELIDVEGYGEMQPAVPGAHTEHEHQQNRRVEFVIVRKK
jgi:outer membrane protein OmpA-like peptidoglycan-associated protein